MSVLSALSSLTSSQQKFPVISEKSPGKSKDGGSFVIDLSWRGQGGAKVDFQSVEFDKQLDRISFWVEKWDHELRCKMLEGLMMRSDWAQVQFLLTVLQPSLHRDFMFTAKKEFPAISFLPISTHTSRKLKEKLAAYRVDNYHRISSAYMQNLDEVKRLSRESVRGHGKSVTMDPLLPSPPAPAPTDQTRHSLKPPLQQSVIVEGEEEKVKRTRSLSPRRSKAASVGGHRLPSIHSLNSPKRFNSQPLPKRPTMLTSAAGISLGSDRWQLMDNGPATFRFVEMPVRRHLQTEGRRHQPERQPQSVRTLAESEAESSIDVEEIPLFETDNRIRFRHVGQSKRLKKEFPKEILQIFTWFTDTWTGPQRNEFLHKLLLKLDPRQHYFISSYLTVRRFKDFIAMLPDNIVIRILDHLSPEDLVNASRVSRAWHRHCNSNQLWRSKVARTRLEIPRPGPREEPEWKEVYRENQKVKINWRDGECHVIDIRGHTERVLAVTFNLRHLASGSLDKTIRVWSMETGKLEQTLSGHSKGVWCIRFFTDNLLISASYDSTIKIWNLRTGRCDRTLIGHDGPVWCLAIHNTTMVSGSQDRTAKVWDIGRCMMLTTLRGHGSAVFAVDMNETGDITITGSADKSVRLWNTRTGKVMKVVWVSTTTSIMAVSFKQGFLACSYSNLICLYKVEGRKVTHIRNFHEHMKRVESIQLYIKDAAALDGILVSAGKDGCLKHWHISSSKSTHTFTGHTRAINCLYFDQLRVATAGYDNKVKIWDFNPK